MDVAVGIDLGTTNSCVAYYVNDRVEIIENKSTGLRTTPSCVTFNKNERLIGKPSKVNENTVYEVKRLIGRHIDDDTVREDIKKWPFLVLEDNKKPIIQVEYKGEKAKFHPEQISAMVLSKMKEIACLHLNKNQNETLKAVITVPAYFNDSQRKATIDAAKIAGLDVLRIINEPTAAALAYGFDKRIKEKKRILVFDLGGGTFDVSIMNIENDRFEVIAINGDTHLGGADFDNRLVDHLKDLCIKKYNKDFSNNKRALNLLKSHCEMAKRELSESVETNIEIDSFLNGEDLIETISRALFEEINSDLFNRTISVLDETIQLSGLNKNNIDEIVLVGGSTRIPKIQNLIKEYFNGKSPFQNINPDEAVAYGAALQARMLCNDELPDLLSSFYIRDVTPLSLGLEVRDGVMDIVVRRNQPIPCKFTKEYTTRHHHQDSISCNIYEGERILTKDNVLLGSFVLDNIQKELAGVPKIEITFNIDSNGILHVTAVDKKTLSQNYINVKNKGGRLNPAEIQNMINLAKKFDQDDKSYLEFINAKYELRIFCTNTLYLLENGMKKLSNLDTAKKELNTAKEWLEGLSSPLTKEEITRKTNYLRNLCKSNTESEK